MNHLHGSPLLPVARMLAACAALLIAPVARAQEPVRPPAVVDTVPRGQRVIVGADTTAQPELLPPISPRRAFLYSLGAPGAAQTLLGRPRAAGIFVLSELIALVMIRQVSEELGEARTLAADSLFLSTDPDGTPRFGPGPFPRELVRARQAQREDWIAFLLANHLFAGLDAYVAAHLWDVPINVGARPAAGQLRFTATLRW